MSRGGLSPRMLLWTAFVVFCTLGMAYRPFVALRLPVVGHVTNYQALLVVATLLGSVTLMRMAGNPERSVPRTMCRILIAYLLFEILVVIPVAIWLGTDTVNTILGGMAVRLTWLLFPVMLRLCADDRVRRAAGVVAVVAAVCLCVWGVYSAATSGAGYYLEFGYLRYRVLYGGALALFAWPFVLTVSQASRRWYAAALLCVSLVGLVLTNMRSGYIAYAIAGLACLAMSGQIRRVVPWVALVASVAAVGWLLWGQLASGVFGYTLSHFFDVSSGNGADRITRDVLAWDFFARYPFNDYVWSWRTYLVNLPNAFGPHNFVLNVATTEGLAGLAFYGSMLTVAFRGAWKWGKRDAVARALVGYLIFYIVFQLANGGWYDPITMALFVAATAGLVARVNQLRAAEASSGLAGDAEYGSRRQRRFYNVHLPTGTASEDGDAS